MYHDHETAGHSGELETYNVVKDQYWWPGLRTFVRNYVKGCAVCQQFKINQCPSHPAYIPTEKAQMTRPFANCYMDMITDLPMVKRLDSLLVMVDQGLMKGVILLPCSKTITAEQMATLLLDNLYKRVGLPNKIISDQGPQFASQSFWEFLKLLGIKSALSTAYHPQTDGATEWVNQEIKAYLSIYCSSHPEDWPNAIPILEFTHNNQRHADQLWTSFELIHGQSLIAILTTFEHTKYPSIEEQINRMIKDWEEALAAHELARRQIADKKKNMFTPFKKGKKVWLDTWNLKTTYHKKMALKREGPFEIEEVMGPVTYKIKLPKDWKIHNAFHVVLLKPYFETETHSKNYTQPPPELLEEQEVYEVETIIKHHWWGCSYQYFIKWKGYPIEEAM